MSFPDTVTVTIDTVAKVLNKINQDKFTSEYLLRGTLDEFSLRIRHTNYTDKTRGKVIDRHNVELVQTVYPVAPAIVSTVRKAYVVFENERADGTTSPMNFDLGFVSWFDASNVTKLLNLES